MDEFGPRFAAAITSSSPTSMRPARAPIRGVTVEALADAVRGR